MTTTPSRPTVPYIAQWSGEAPIERRAILASIHGIAYDKETSADRDARGVLWSRNTTAQGVGQPILGSVHPQRQRVVMEVLLCQVCGGLADQDERGTLWLLEDRRGDWEGWPEDLLTAHPPVCRPCAQVAVRACPNLRGRYVAVRVGETDVCAVIGVTYTPTRQGLVPGPRDAVALTSPAIRWTVAGQLVRGLNECTIVSL